MKFEGIFQMDSNLRQKISKYLKFEFFKQIFWKIS